MSEKTFGVELFQYTDAHEVLRDALLAEELGLASVWLGDSQLLWREVYVLLGAVAARTERIVLAAAGPRMLRLAGEIADGVIVQGRCAPDATMSSMIEEVRAGRRAAGRESGRFLVASAAAAAVHADRRKALDAVKPLVSVQLL